MPLSAILDGTLEAHEQDIRQGIFEYEFEAAKNDTDRQAALIQERSDELKKAADFRKMFIKALREKNGNMSEEEIAGLANAMGISADKLDAWSVKLEEHALGLGKLKDHMANDSDTLPPAISDINMTLPQGNDKKNDDKKNGNNGNGNGNGNSNWNIINAPDKKGKPS